MGQLGRLDRTNPFAHLRIRGYLKFFQEEQADLAVIPSQAVRLFLKFYKLVAHLREKILNNRSLSTNNRYVLVLCYVFCRALFCGC